MESHKLWVIPHSLIHRDENIEMLSQHLGKTYTPGMAENNKFPQQLQYSFHNKTIGWREAMEAFGIKSLCHHMQSLFG